MQERFRAIAFWPIILPLLVLGCSSQTASDRAAIFDLRQKCVQLAEQWPDQATHDMLILHRSHYSIRDNRCYVTVENRLLDVHMESLVLYDGQTKENLASAGIDEKGKKFGAIGAKEVGYEAAQAYIHRLTEDQKTP